MNHANLIFRLFSVGSIKKIIAVFLFLLINVSVVKADLWIDAKNLCIEGRGWTEGISDYTRLPDKYQSVVRPEVWDLSRHSSGITVRFTVTGTSFVRAKWQLRSSRTMYHMTYQGINGVDLYAKRNGKWVHAGVGTPVGTNIQQDVQLRKNLKSTETYEFMLYLPLYNGVTSVELGFSDGAVVKAAKPFANKPIVCYGTSILQGCSASRPGMSYTSQLARYFNTSAVNFGFSGNGQAEDHFGDIMGEIDASIYIIDCIPNSGGFAPEEITNRNLVLARKIWALRPAATIILAEDRTQQNYFFNNTSADMQSSRVALKAAYDILKKENQNIYYLDGDLLFANNSDATVDGSHPSDLGLYLSFLAWKNLIEEIVQSGGVSFTGM